MGGVFGLGDEGFVRINLAEALRRVKYNHGKSKKEALRILANAEVSLLSKLDNPKFWMGGRTELKIEDYGYEAYINLSPLILKSSFKKPLLGESVPKGSLSAIIDDYISETGDHAQAWNFAYDQLIKSIWSVENEDQSSPGEKYVKLADRLSGRLLGMEDYSI